ncbi:MAG: hypothetical protein LUH63_22645 [Parabacteroides sp.]|nr:hypothetical protein [Parabacteroides sp.]
MVVWGQASSPTTLYIDKGPITIGSTSISGYDQNGNKITATNSDGYIITQTDASTPTSNTITVDNSYSGTITLNNVNIIAPREQAAFNAQYATNVTLRLMGNNTLESTYERPALRAPEGEGRTLTIEADPSDPYGSLKATGAPYWPGIGVYRGSSLNITINSGYITATGGSGNSGIGPSSGYDECTGG